MEPFRRDRLTWVAYGMLAWFAYLQAAPGLVVPHLRDELHLSYSTGGLHVAAWAGGSVLAGLITAPLDGYHGNPSGLSLHHGITIHLCRPLNARSRS